MLILHQFYLVQQLRVLPIVYRNQIGMFPILPKFYTFFLIQPPMAKAIKTMAMGVFGGLATMALSGSVLLQNPLREASHQSGCCRSHTLFQGRPVWWFWRISERHDTFVTTFTSNGMFLLKWLSLAYVLEALMLRYVPADWIAGASGGTGLGTIALAALIGVPAY